MFLIPWSYVPNTMELPYQPVLLKLGLLCGHKLFCLNNCYSGFYYSHWTCILKKYRIWYLKWSGSSGTGAQLLQSGMLTIIIIQLNKISKTVICNNLDSEPNTHGNHSSTREGKTKQTNKKVRMWASVGCFFNSFNKIFKANIDSDWIESIASRDGKECSFPKKKFFLARPEI